MRPIVHTSRRSRNFLAGFGAHARRPVFPWTWVARRIYRQFAYGLSRIGKMQVYTSSGAGTWGPPLRLGSSPEIVLLQFE